MKDCKLIFWKMRILKINSLPSVKESWQDRDHIMLHACFQLLVDFIEKEDGLNHCNYDSHKETVDILQELYGWWKIESDKIHLNNAEDVQNKLELLIKNRGFLWT